MTTPPFPPSGHFIAKARSTARSVREAANIKINTEAIDNLLSTVPQSTFDRLKEQHGVSFPLRFTSLEDEVNFLAVLSLLNTLSGYREAFHKATGQGAYQNVVKLLFGLYITQPGDAGESLLSAKGLKGLSAETVEQIWGVSSYTEQPHESIPGVTVGQRGGDMNDVVQLVVRCCNETGTVLLDAGFQSLGQYVLQVIGEAEKMIDSKGDVAAADYIVEKIVTLIPGFQDMSTVLSPPQPIYIFKKAFFCIFAIYQRLQLRAASDPSTPLPRLANPEVLPMFVDNVLPTMSLHLSLIDATESTVPALKSWAVEDAAYKNAQQEAEASTGKSVKEGPRLSAEEAYIIRAAALDAGRVARERAVELSSRDGLGWLREMTEADFDGYLWSVAKDDAALRRVPRMVERDTIMY